MVQKGKKFWRGDNKKEVVRTKKGDEETFKRQREEKGKTLREARQPHLLISFLLSVPNAR